MIDSPGNQSVNNNNKNTPMCAHSLEYSKGFRSSVSEMDKKHYYKSPYHNS